MKQEEFVRWLAVSRIYLDNFRHIRTSVLTQNDNAFLALNYGANDFDIPTEDEVTQKAGAVIDDNFDHVLNTCAQAGYKPVLRKSFEGFCSTHT